MSKIKEFYNKNKQTIDTLAMVSVGGALLYFGYKYGVKTAVNSYMTNNPQKVKEFEDAMSEQAVQNVYERARDSLRYEVKEEMYRKAFQTIKEDEMPKVADSIKKSIYKQARKDLEDDVRSEMYRKAKEQVREEFKEMAELVGEFTEKRTRQTIVMEGDD